VQNLTDISVRTLRYYDEIEILKSSKIIGSLIIIINLIIRLPMPCVLISVIFKHINEITPKNMPYIV